jgi:diguanylate cyclase (GGDEF)-like protein
MTDLDTSITPKQAATLLFVDDDTNVLKSLQRLFHHDEYRIILANSGAIGLETLQQEAVDLVISDMRMPEMNGVDFLSQVYENWPNTIRILLTGYADLQLTIDAVNKGRIYNYCNKPWHDQELKLLVRNALEQKHLREERDSLTQQIHQKNAELKTLNHQLEHLLDHRTQQLDQANINLNLKQEQLIYQANFDDLTGLINRNHLRQHFAQALRLAEQNHTAFCIFFLDIDSFKVINDSLGHSVGDELLKVTAQRLLDCTLSNDSVARYDGDGFVLILPQIAHIHAATQLAERIIANISTPLELSGHLLEATVSIGISFYPQDGLNEEVLLQHADAALYEAKAKGRNTYRFFTKELNDYIIQRLTLEEDLRQALKLEQFIVYYQPKVDLASGKLSGMEALLRWQHPERGMIQPDHFIPVAEDTGLIVSIGEWVLKTACAQTRAWQQAGFTDISMAVNVSPKQLHSNHFEHSLSKILQETGLDAQYLDLEVTEGAVMQEPEKIILTLKRLKEIGVKLSMDDFGTGYSSLSYLKRFPFDHLKIDKAFINDIPNNIEDETLVLTIIAMAHNFKLKVIAEGVETQAQVAFLSEKKCDEIQGYYFSKPLPAHAAIQLLEKSWLV